MKPYVCISIDETFKIAQKKDCIIGDLRGEEAYEEGHIENSLLLDNVGLFQLVHYGDKSKPVILYCRSGRRSRLVSYYLAARGFKALFSMEGGFDAWKEKYHFKTGI